MAEDAYHVNLARVSREDVLPRTINEEVTPPSLLTEVRRHRLLTLENPRSGDRHVRMLLAQAVFNLPDYHDLVVACEAAQRALRSGPTKEKDYSYELGLLNKALK